MYAPHCLSQRPSARPACGRYIPRKSLPHPMMPLPIETLPILDRSGPQLGTYHIPSSWSGSFGSQIDTRFIRSTPSTTVGHVRFLRGGICKLRLLHNLNRDGDKHKICHRWQQQVGRDLSHRWPTLEIDRELLHLWEVVCTLTKHP